MNEMKYVVVEIKLDAINEMKLNVMYWINEIKCNDVTYQSISCLATC